MWCFWCVCVIAARISMRSTIAVFRTIAMRSSRVYMWIVVDMIEAVVRVRGFVDVWLVRKRRISMGIIMWVAIYMAVKQLPIVVVRITVAVPVAVWSVTIWLIDMWIRIAMRIRIVMWITIDVIASTVDMR